MYKPLEKKAKALFKKAEKSGAPAWILQYCQWKIYRAGSYREEAKCCKKEWRQNRMVKAVDSIVVALDILESVPSNNR